MPRGDASASVSETATLPPKFEKRTVTETLILCRCGALLTEDAEALGRNTPSRSTPFAWLARTLGLCSPKTALGRVLLGACGLSRLWCLRIRNRSEQEACHCKH